MTTEHLPLLVELDADAEVLRYIVGRARSPQEVYDYCGPICADTKTDAVASDGGSGDFAAPETSSGGGTSTPTNDWGCRSSEPKQAGG